MQGSFALDSKEAVDRMGSWRNRFWQERPSFLHLALFYAAYALVGGFGQGLIIIPGVSVGFWPPAGIFVATLLLTSKDSWPWWVAAACLAELTCNAIWFHNAIPFAMVYFGANALMALTAAGLINRFAGKPFRLETLGDITALVVLGAGIAPLVSATIIAATDSLLGKHPFWTAWPMVWLGDGTGLLVSTPLTLVTVQAWRDRTKIAPSRLFEAMVVLGILLAVGALSFKGYLLTPYMLLPPLLWAAARFQFSGAVGALALIAVMEALFVVTNEGALAGQTGQLAGKIIGLQTFLCIAAISSLVVAALSQQHNADVRLLQDTNTNLETRVTERTEELQASERQLSAMFAAIDVGMGQADLASRRLVRVNAAMSAITGYSEAELLEITVDDLNHPDDRAEDRDAWRKIGRENGYAIEKRYLRKDGSTVWVQVTANPIHDAEGKPFLAAAVVHDITARKQAEDALLASEAFSRSVLESSPDCVKVISPDGKLEFMNGNGLKQMEIDDFNFCKGELWSTLWPEETRHRISQSLVTAREGTESRFEALCPTAKGTPKWWDVAVSPVLDSQRRCTRIVSVSRDITDRKRHEEHQVLLMNELNHRVKNTLATIQSMASQTLRLSPTLAEAKIRFEARLISLSKAHDVLTREKWDSAPLHDIVNQAIAPYLGSRKDRFAVDGPDIRITAQMALAFAMALHELCTNAVKYGALSMDKGQVSITWKVSGQKTSKPFLRFRWNEKGGPPVTPPSARGFGTKLIERSLASDLGGDVEIRFARSGVSCVINFPLGIQGEH